MRWLFISPHYDDAIFSCGGLIWQESQSGRPVEILTICGGDPPDGELSAFAGELHARWGVGREVAAVRRAEDAAACAAVGCQASRLEIPDCIYRLDPSTGRFLVERNKDLFRPDPPAEEETVALICARLNTGSADTRVVCPLGIGGHIDHRLARRAAESLGQPLWYYADFPYSGRPGAGAEGLVPSGCRPERINLSPEAVEKWADATACYQSQISTFWPSREELRSALHSYYQLNPAGHTLWQRP